MPRAIGLSNKRFESYDLRLRTILRALFRPPSKSSVSLPCYEVDWSSDTLSFFFSQVMPGCVVHLLK